MKIAAVVILSAVLLLVGVQIYSFLKRRAELSLEFSDISAKLNRAKLEQEKFRAELDYYLNPANLEKELRARFNYKAPGEKLLIIVPKGNSTSE